jgi:hypothetical protein
MVKYRISLLGIGRVKFNQNVFLRQEFTSYDEAKKVAQEKGKANVWVNNTVVGTYNESYGYRERIEESRHDIL